MHRLDSEGSGRDSPRVRCRQTFPPHWPLSPSYDSRFRNLSQTTLNRTILGRTHWNLRNPILRNLDLRDFDQADRPHLIEKPQNILPNFFRINLIFFRNRANHFRNRPRRIQELPNQRTGFVEAVNRSQVAHFSAHRNNQRFSRNHAGRHRSRAHENLPFRNHNSRFIPFFRIS
jgi:hypothetical protein